MKEENLPEDFKPVVAFHGHLCPGLTIGYRAANAARKALGIERDQDEELVAVVENDACGVDAIQYILGCTLGKGNLIFRDLGKQAFTVFRRHDSKSVRLVFRGNIGTSDPAAIALRRKVMNGQATVAEQQQNEQQRTQRMKDLLAATDEELFDFKQPDFVIPESARIFDSFACEQCGETTMEQRLRLVDGRKVCLTCAEPYHRGW